MGDWLLWRNRRPRPLPTKRVVLYCIYHWARSRQYNPKYVRSNLNIQTRYDKVGLLMEGPHRISHELPNLSLQGGCWMARMWTGIEPSFIRAFTRLLQPAIAATPAILYLVARGWIRTKRIGANNRFISSCSPLDHFAALLPYTLLFQSGVIF